MLWMLLINLRKPIISSRGLRNTVTESSSKRQCMKTRAMRVNEGQLLTTEVDKLPRQSKSDKLTVICSTSLDDVSQIAWDFLRSSAEVKWTEWPTAVKSTSASHLETCSRQSGACLMSRTAIERQKVREVHELICSFQHLLKFPLLKPFESRVELTSQWMARVRCAAYKAASCCRCHWCGQRSSHLLADSWEPGLAGANGFVGTQLQPQHSRVKQKASTKWHTMLGSADLDVALYSAPWPILALL